VPNEALARSCAQFTARPKPDSLNEARKKLVAGLCCRSQRNKDESAAWARIAPWHTTLESRGDA
jgi:hypothetical protein